jgi:LPS-assembly lipoprotein
MWLRNRLLCFGLALALAGCGFKPLHGAGDNGAAGGHLAVEVTRIANREGQTLRAALEREFNHSRAPTYRLDVTLAERITTSAIDTEGDAIRRRMTITASWRFLSVDASQQSKPLAGSIRVFEGFNVLRSDFANISAERQARERASIRLASQIAEAVTALAQ